MQRRILRDDPNDRYTVPPFTRRGRRETLNTARAVTALRQRNNEDDRGRQRSSNESAPALIPPPYLSTCGYEACLCR